MKKQSYMVMVLAAVLVLLVASFVPHHHHAYELCTIVEHCEHDNADNDRHTDHADDGTSCVEEGGFVLSKCQSCYSGVVGKQGPVFAFVASLMVLDEPCPTFISPAPHGYTLLYIASAHLLGKDLRAPPALL